MSAKPLARTFRTEAASYVYDAGTNDFYRVDPAMYELLDRGEPHGGPESLTELRQAQARGILAADRFAGIETPTSDDVAARLKSDVGALILEITQSCNLRCSYCSFSGNYPLNRIHSPLSMKWSVAQAAIDQYLSLCQAPTIGFFGGEPLIKIELIAKCMDYASSRSGARVAYNLTTNGTLLDEESIVLFANHKVSLSISIDGPKPVHDSVRRTLAGGPTWEGVLANVRLAAQLRPEWYRRHVNFLMVAAPPYDLRPYEEFVARNPELFVTPKMAVLSFVNPIDSSTEWMDTSDSLKKKSELHRLRANYRDAHIAGHRERLTVEPSLFDRAMYMLRYRRAPRFPGEPAPLNGSCIPVLRRLFVDAVGGMHICERINSTLPIGDVSRGPDLQTIMRHLDEFASVTREECTTCWAGRLCPICLAHAAGNGRCERAKKLSLCEDVKADLVENFILYNEILEAAPNAFDYMDAYYMI